VTTSVSLTPAPWGFALAGCALVVLLAQLLCARCGGLRALMFALATAISALWALLGLAHALDPIAGFWSWWCWFDLARSAAWTAFVVALLSEYRMHARPRVPLSAPAFVLALVAAVVVGGLFPGSPLASAAAPQARIGLAVSLGLAVLGLVCVEQLIRNTASDRRWGLTRLAIGVGGMFAFDLYLYADGVLFGQLNADVWGASA
jgi:hypothetical protein